MPHQGLLFVSRTSGARSFALPGLTVTALVNPKRAAVSEAAKPGANDIPYKAFFTASQARGILENFTNDKRLTARQFSRKELTEQLNRILILRGENGLGQLRDEAREVAQKLDMPQEFKALDSLIGVLLGTNAATKQTTNVMGTFEAALRDPIYSQPPQTVEDFLAWIKQVNATVMRSRPEKNPGEWKSRDKGFKLLSPLTGEKMAVPL